MRGNTIWYILPVISVGFFQMRAICSLRSRSMYIRGRTSSFAWDIDQPSKYFDSSYLSEARMLTDSSGTNLCFSFVGVSINFPAFVYVQPSDASGSATFSTTRAGTPYATENSGMSLVTSDPAPIVQPFPIVTPGRTVVPAPSQQSSPIVTGRVKTIPSRRD